MIDPLLSPLAQSTKYKDRDQENTSSDLQDWKWKPSIYGRYRPSTTTSSSWPEEDEHRLWILPLNCNVTLTQHPVVLVLAEWGSKSHHFCRLLSQKWTDQSFGAEWARGWRGFQGMTRRAYIREADTQSCRDLHQRYFRAPSLPLMNPSSVVDEDLLGVGEESLPAGDYDLDLLELYLSYDGRSSSDGVLFPGW